MAANRPLPVSDWATDCDIFDPDYVRAPVSVWDELRERCPIAATERWNRFWLQTNYEDLQAYLPMVPS